MAESFEYAPWLREFAAASSDPFIRDSEKEVQYFIELDEKVPAKYGWRATSVDAFRRQVDALGTKSAQTNLQHEKGQVGVIEEMNRLYWHDMARNIAAYSIMAFWRGSELIRSSLRALNRHDVLAPAVLSRSLMELGCVLIVDSNLIYKTMSELRNNQSISVGKGHGIIVSKDMEELVVRLINGTRIEGAPEELSQKNVLSYIQKVGETPASSRVPAIYEHLCDIAHPNVWGNARFVRSSSHNPDGSETLILERFADSVNAKRIRHSILWAMGWSAVCIRNGFTLCDNATGMILEIWPKG